MRHDAETADDETAAPAQSGDHADHARTHVLKPFAAKGSREPEEHDGHGENPHHRRQAPVARRCGHHAELFGQRRVEDTPCVDRADTQMNGDRCWRNLPAVKTVFRDDVFLFQPIKHALKSSQALFVGHFSGVLDKPQVWQSGYPGIDFKSPNAPAVGHAGIRKASRLAECAAPSGTNPEGPRISRQRQLLSKFDANQFFHLFSINYIPAPWPHGQFVHKDPQWGRLKWTFCPSSQKALTSKD